MSDITRNAVQTQEHWADDNAVANCQDEECPLAAPGSAAGVAFSRTLRKHHCRFCGGIFCWKCAADYITLSTSKGKKPFRACKGCVLEYKANCFEVELRLGSTQSALPESDERVEAFRGGKPKGWGASLPSWGKAPPVFQCKAFVALADPAATPQSLQRYLSAVTFDLKPGLRTPREKTVVPQPPYELEFLADAKGECKMTLLFKDGEVIYRHQVSLKVDQEQEEQTRAWTVCTHATYQLDGSDLPRSPSARGLLKMAKTVTKPVGKLGVMIGRTSLTGSTTSDPPQLDDDQLDDWLKQQEKSTDDSPGLPAGWEDEAAKDPSELFAQAALTGEPVAPPPPRRPREPEPEPEQAAAAGHFAKAIYFRVEKRSRLDPSCEPSPGHTGTQGWLDVGAVVEVLETQWVGEEMQRVRTADGWTTAVSGSTKYLKRDRKATCPCAAPSSSGAGDGDINSSVDAGGDAGGGAAADHPSAPGIPFGGELDESVDVSVAGAAVRNRTVSAQLDRDRQLVAEQNKQRAERERLANEGRLAESKRKREELAARLAAEEEERARAQAEAERVAAEKRAEQEREALRLEKEKAERMAAEAELRAAESAEAARIAAEERQRKKLEEEKAEEERERIRAERAAAKKKEDAAWKRERAKVMREREGKGGTLLVSVGHLSLTDDDIGQYVPILKLNCDNVEATGRVFEGQHRAIRSPEYVPYQMTGGTDFHFAVQPSCKNLLLDLWNESTLTGRFNTVLGSKQVPLSRVRCADSAYPEHYEASPLGGVELPRDSGTWSAVSDDFELKDVKSGKTKGKICLTMRWAPWPDEGSAEDEQVTAEFKEPGPLGTRRAAAPLPLPRLVCAHVHMCRVCVHMLLASS
jgi:hypothetical protein